MESDNSPKLWAAVGQTIQPRPFESIKLEIGISGIALDATPEEIAAQLQEATYRLDLMINGLAVKLNERMTAVKAGAEHEWLKTYLLD